MTLDDATARLVGQLSAAGRGPVWEMTPEQARAGTVALRALVGPGPEMAEVIDTSFASTDGREVPVRFLVPAGDVKGVAVYLHGGGWMVGSIDDFDTLAREVAARSGWAVAVVGYAKAPELPFPAGLDDAWHALVEVDVWRRQRSADLPLAVVGDSSGGNLAAVIARRAADAGSPSLSLQVLIYPVTDGSLESDSYADPSNQLLLDRQAMEFYWDQYAGQHDRTAPDLSPARAPSLAHVAPAVVLTAEHDVLRDEGEAYAQRLHEFGALKEIERYEGQMHGFFSMVNILPGSIRAIDHVARSLRTVSEEARS